MMTPNHSVAPAPRITVKLPVTLTFEESSTTAKGISENMSETGVLVLTSRKEPEGAIAKLSFQTFDATAEVRWAATVEGDVRLGMKFVYIDERGREFVHRFSEYLRDHGYAQ